MDNYSTERNRTHKLPAWIDSYIFNTLDANYCKSNSDMTVIDWDKKMIQNYLGTYFPRSYVEARSIFTKEILQGLSKKRELSILDFGCGTGGEIIGLLSNIEHFLPNVEEVTITAIDGNHDALRVFEKVLSEYKKRSRLKIYLRVAPIKIIDFYDLTVLDEIITDKFDLIISFKAICEFVTKSRFEEHNPYGHIIKTFLPRLNQEGMMVLVDVTSCNKVSKEWIPKMMDVGLSEVSCTLLSKNEGYNQSFCLSHSGTNGMSDVSKVCWRIIKNKY